MNRVVEVNRKDKEASKIAIGNVVDTLSNWLPEGQKVIIITDSNVHRHYKQIINQYEHIIIGIGETCKTLQTIEKVCSALIEMRADRGCFIVGIGGGIVTDTTGFVASIFLRGVRFGFIATTLLAQVDASIGGKNGVNLDGYKNMIGVFNQPEFVLCDTSLLKTLPEREFKAGLAEVIKTAMISNCGLFERLEGANIESIKSDNKLLVDIITSAILVKAEVVTADETEQGVRKKLNLGHTFAHAIEKSTSRFLHGEAVSIGIVIISKLALQMAYISDEYYNRVIGLLEKYDLPTDSEVSMPKLLKALQTDKKRDGDGINIILPSGFGECEIVRMSFDELNSHFEDTDTKSV